MDRRQQQYVVSMTYNKWHSLGCMQRELWKAQEVPMTEHMPLACMHGCPELNICNSHACMGAHYSRAICLRAWVPMTQYVSCAWIQTEFSKAQEVLRHADVRRDPSNPVYGAVVAHDTELPTRLPTEAEYQAHGERSRVPDAW